jgi:hypothetical protein
MVVAPVLEAYGKFSPSVVRDMESDLILKDSILTYVVKAAFYLVNLVEVYLETDAELPDLLVRMSQALGQYASEVEEAGGSAITLSTAAAGALLACQQLQGSEIGRVHALGHYQWPQDLFPYIASTIKASGCQTFGFAWGLEGMEMILRHTAANFGRNGPITPGFPEALGAWLARPPIPSDATLSLSDAPKELQILGERLYTRSYTRKLFLQHLLAQSPATLGAELRELLRNLDFMKADS